MKFKFAHLAVGTILLAGCGGRVAIPVQTSQSSDSVLTCSHISAEMKSIQQYIAELTQADSDKAGHNVGTLLLIGPFWLDATDTEKKEILTIHARNKRLAELGEAKNCQKLPKLLALPTPEAPAE